MIQENNEHLKFLKRAIELAQSAAKNGNHPFGALIVLNGKILLERENTVHTNKDITQHAELNLISAASGIFTKSELMKAILFTSSEPCAMCAGAIYWSGIRKIVYGCSAETLGIAANESFVTDCRSILAFSKEDFQIQGPLLEKESSLIHKTFWTSKNKEQIRNESIHACK